MGVNRSQRHLREGDGAVDSSGWDGQPIDYSGGGGLLPPVIDSVNVTKILGPNGDGFIDAVNLSGGPVDPALTEYLYTDFSSITQDNPVPAYPGPSWTAYTGDPGDDDLDWDTLGSENGPLNQPTAAGPYIGQNPWFDFDTPNVDAGGGGRWKRLQITVANAAGSDSAFIFWAGDAF